jgi:hypothetical protein
MGKNRSQRFSKFGKGRGKGWEKKTFKQGMRITDFELQKRIIGNNQALKNCYLQKLAEAAAAGERGKRAQQTAIALTKTFAEENKILWEI